MFGGLELKGGAASKDADGNAETDPTPEPSVPAAMSSFGFMNVGAPAEPAPAAPPAPAAAAVSSFSFLNPTAPEPAPATPNPSSPAATATASASVTSGFSFMMPESTTTTATDPAVENPAPSSVAATAAPSSGFDFMNSMATPAATSDAAIAPADAATSAAAVVEESIIPTIAEETPAAEGAAPAPSVGFWSLTETPLVAPSDGSSPAIPSAMPTTVHTRTNSVGSVSSALSAPSVAPAPTSTPAQTGGLISGVTFGTSSAKPRIKKKKKRTARVGVGANHNDTSAATPAPVPAAPTPPVAKDESKSARDAAQEVTNRAEAFMQAKAMEDARSATETKTTTTTSAVSSSAAVLKTESAADFGLNPTESMDEVLAAAKEAAEQAKTMQHQQKGKGFMGTFFKGFRASPNTVGMARSSGSMSNSSKHSVGSNSSSNAMDRLAKEQKAMKQAMAKRQLHQKQEQQQSKKDGNDDDNDEVVVTTSVGGYTPATAEPMEYTSVTDNADAITKTAISEGSAFVSPPSPQKSSFSFMLPSYGEPAPIVESPLPVAPPVKIDNSPKQIFEHHQKYFSEAVNQAMKKVDDARNLKKGLLEERFVALAKDRFATREIEQIEELLQAAIDEEDYEQADELGQKLDAHKREKSEVENMLANNKNALEKLESENTSLGERVVSCFEDLALRLGDLKKKEAASEKKDGNEILTRYASISKQLSAEHERLQQDLKHLERDEQLVGEERNELEDSIKDQTGEIETQKEESSSKLTEVEKEIEELRNTLQRKQKEAADLRTSMFGFEDSISKVRVKFSRQLTRVDKKEISLKESRREWEIENQQQKIQKDAHDLQVLTHSDTLLAHEELTKSLDSELRLSKEFSQIIPTQLGFMDDKESEAEEKDADDEGSLAQLKANVVKCEGAIDVAKKTLKMASTAIQNLQSELDMLVARIPELEAQKKAAAAGRDFKAAGKFSKEIKDATARIKVCEEELNGDTKAKKASAEETLRQLDSEFLEAKKIADAREKLSGEKRMEILAKKIAQLVQEKAGKCGESESEGWSVKSVAARVLEGQIMILVAEGQEIGSKYGGWDELMASVDLDDEASTSSIKGVTQDPNNLTVDDVEQGDGEENIGDGVTSEERVTKIEELLAKCSEMEMQVEEAAAREDFDAAGELQETLDKINVEIEELNITDEECELLAGIDVIDSANDIVPPEQQEQEERGLTNEERLAKAKELMAKQIELEQKVEEAAEEEDFEAAEELQTTIDQITAELTELNITDEEKELLATEDSPSDAVSVQEEEANETIEGVEEEEEISSQEEANETILGVEDEKKEGDEENASDLDQENLENGEETSAEKEETNDFEKDDNGAISDDESKPIEEGESPEQVDAADAEEV